MRALVFLPFALSLLGCDIHRQLGDDLQVQPVAPLAGAGTGSINSPLAGRPTLRWTANSQAQTYHLQIDDSCTAAATCDFPSPEIDEAALTTTFYVPPSALPGSSTAPFSRRYYWRVQACKGDSCGEWSATRIFVVGQERTLNRDINGDGYPDFVVQSGGQAFLFLGGRTLPSSPALVVDGVVPCDGLGKAVAMAGDVNGDGYGDFLVSPAFCDKGGGAQPPMPYPGSVWLFFGGPSLKTKPDIVFEAPIGASTSVASNGSMAGCDDLNGDGYDDIAFATADYDASAMLVLPGRVEIHFGGPDMASSAPLVLHGELQPQSDANPNGDDGFGYSVSAAGDVNGDGYPDLIVGSRTLQPSDNMVGGKVRIYYGGPQMDSTPDVVLELAKTTDVGPEADVFGASVAGVGDVNGDGFADVAVGAPGFDVNFGGTAISRVYVYFGGTVTHASPDLELRGGRDSEELGTLVVPAGDVDHDGYADIAVLAPGIPPALGWNPNLFGKVYIFSGGPNAGQSTITSLSAGNDLFGGLAVLDIDGDGEAEMLVGQGNYYSADVATGWVSIYRKSDGYAVPARKLLDGVSWDHTIGP